MATNASQNEWYLQNDKIGDFISTQIQINEKSGVEDIFKSLDDRYLALKKKLKESSEPAFVDLVNCLQCHRDNVYGQYAPRGWTLYRAGGYITFYPTHWLEKFGGTKTCCVHFELTWNKEPKLQLCI